MCRCGSSAETWQLVSALAFWRYKMGNGIDCTCGSGAHPKQCKTHPFNFDLHVAELNLYGALCDSEECTSIEATELIDKFRLTVENKIKHEIQPKNT